MRLPLIVLMCAAAVTPTLAEPANQSVPAYTGQVFKSDSCDCCNKWVGHMKSKGFLLEPKDIPASERTRMRAHLGIAPEHAACHTAIIEGYIVEGHVPAEDVTRLLAEKPDAKGIAVRGMPAGSPGMEMEDGSSEPYEVLLLKKDGTTEVFARHP